MITDYKSKKERLAKKPTHYNFFDAHFNLAEGDDSWGFENNPINKTDKSGIAIYILCTIAILYFIGNVIWSISNLPVVQIETPTYTDLKPLPEMNWNFTPINERQEQPAPLPKITFNQLER
jgi:hypothetical protein